MTQNILHMFFTEKHASPFDINMAVDAGFNTVVPYTNVVVDDVQPLIQDCIFSRPPGFFNHSGVFIGGRDINIAADMVDAARAAMVRPFEVSVFADPNGAYTTSAATLALVGICLQQSNSSLADSTVTVFGGGPVGLCALILASQAGATPVLARLTPANSEKQAMVDQFLDRYDVAAKHIDAQSAQNKIEALRNTDVVISTARAGIEVLSADMLKQSGGVKVAADVNAVPPAGIAGIGAQHKGVELDTLGGGLGIGALAIGNVKYKTQQALLKTMQHSPDAVILEFSDAYSEAVRIATA